jgi:replication fork clamp-binding protein CrfC
MQQYRKTAPRPRPAKSIIEDAQARAATDDLAQRLQWTQQLVEQQRRELRRLEGLVEALSSAVNKLTR